MRERKRRHDDVHFPLQGRGKRAPRGAQAAPPIEPMTAEDFKKQGRVIGWDRDNDCPIYEGKT